MWDILTMDYYSALKRSEFLIHATTWMILENISLSEKVDIKRQIRAISLI